MDGSTHRWFGDKKSCLIAMIDDANSQLFAEFFLLKRPLDACKFCARLLKPKVYLKHCMLTVRASLADLNAAIFHRCSERVKNWVSRLSLPAHHRGKDESNALSIPCMTDSFLSSERNIDDMAAANAYLQHVFIPQVWHQQMTVKPVTPHTEYQSITAHVNLDDICIIKVHRKMRNDHTFTYKGQFYFIESPIRHSIAHQKIEIRNVQRN